MQKEFVFSELSIVIVAENHNPTLLNPDFLKFNDIVPREWVVGQPPLCTHPISQVEYKNGIKITAELNKLILFQPKYVDSHSDSNIPDIAKRYVEVLRHVNYIAVGINPRGHFEFDNNNILANYFINKLLRKGPWADFSGGVRSVSIKLSYQLESGTFSVGIDQASLRTDKTRANNLLSISGNFHHTISTNTEKTYNKVIEIVDDMDSDLDRCLSFCKLLPEI